MTTRAQGLRRLVEAETGSGPRRAHYVNQASLLGEYFEQLPDAAWLTDADYELFPTTSVDVLVFNTVDEPVWAIIWDHDHTGMYDTDRLHLARVCAALNLPLLRVNEARWRPFRTTARSCCDGWYAAGSPTNTRLPTCTRNGRRTSRPSQKRRLKQPACG